jgi:hypothetical protein
MPRKVFDSFTRLDASDVNTFLMDQTVQSFAGTAARGSAITTPVEGMVTYLNDSNSVQVYDSATWNTLAYESTAPTITSSTAVSYTVASSDTSKTLRFTAGSAVSVSFGTATAFDPGDRVDILWDGAGTVTINRDGTVVSLAGRGTAGTAYRIGQRYEAVSVLCVDTNAYRVIGNATAV